jgi:uncharacterized protein (UPF0264 family)
MLSGDQNLLLPKGNTHLQKVKRKQRLLVSVRGTREALEAASGGAHIADVEYPASALGTPYPLNVRSVRSALSKRKHRGVAVSTNIGETQNNRASACQAALGIATAGADAIKFGLAELSYEAAEYLAKTIVRTVHTLSPNRKNLYPAVFVDDDMRRSFDPFRDAARLAKASMADGVLIDTFNKLNGKGLLDYCSVEDIASFVKSVHSLHKEAWIAGSITLEELPALWGTGVDVICVRGAACQKETSLGRFGEVKASVVARLVATIPKT